MIESSIRATQTAQQAHRDPSVVETVCEACLERVRKENGDLRALRAVDADRVMRQAKQVMARISSGDTSMALAGVPVVVKDNISEAGLPTRAGRGEAVSGVAERSAVLIDRLTRAGAVVLGRANMDELAYGVTGTNAHTGQIRNPWNRNCHPGGSSAGSAVAVAAGFAPLAIGTDTAGSVRIPASLCGLVGLRPSYGLCPADGVMPLARSFDCVGPLATNVSDVALLLSVIADLPELSQLGDGGESLEGLGGVVLEGRFAYEVDDAVREACVAACSVLSDAGLRMSQGEIGELSDAPRASGPIIGAEASHAWASEFEAHPDWFGHEVAGHLQKGMTMTAVRYLRARDDRLRITKAIEAVLETADVLLLPTTATPAGEIAAPGAQLRYLALTVPFSLSGHPALSIPVGRVRGLPVGLQVVGRRGREADVLRVGHALETRINWRAQVF